MLQIALAPAPVARGKIDEGGRALFVTAAKVRQHIDSIARAADQGRLDEVMAEDQPAEWRTPFQGWQTAMVGEGPGANDRIMSPIIAVASHPGGNARRDDRPVNPGGELLDPREQSIAVDDQRQ